MREYICTQIGLLQRDCHPWCWSQVTLGMTAQTTPTSLSHMAPVAVLTSPMPGCKWYNWKETLIISSENLELDLRGGQKFLMVLNPEHPGTSKAGLVHRESEKDSF